ncbi:MAG TPA: hypothetical protein VHB79_33820 [Polyangiaceae bacterium]|nr:hypothetical protein [Polyangiaceae bacterium]
MSGTVSASTSLRLPWLVRYLSELTTPRLVLWCYLIWYGFVLVRYFDPSLRLWLSSLGISAIIGTGLYLSTAHGGRVRTKLETWQVVRLYMMPFCVSSFAALIKGRGFLLVFDASLLANAAAGAGCAAFVALALACRKARAALSP